MGVDSTNKFFQVKQLESIYDFKLFPTMIFEINIVNAKC